MNFICFLPPFQIFFGGNYSGIVEERKYSAGGLCKLRHQSWDPGVVRNEPSGLDFLNQGKHESLREAPPDG